MHMQITESTPYLSPCFKTKSKWVEELNVKPEIFTLFEDTMHKTLEVIDIGEGFCLGNRTPGVQGIVSRIKRWDHMKSKSFCNAKATSDIVNI